MDTSKVIKGVVNSGRYTVTAPIIKEDYGLYLQIEGVELPQTYEVDFSNSENSGTSVTMIGNSDGVLIPHQFIDTGKDIFAFLYHVGANYGRTVYKFRIPNKLRPDRTDDTPTPEEQSVIDQTISALNSAVAQTAQDVIDADASAQSASQSAENAHDSAVDAQNYANNAQTSATSAQTSASQASASATASAQSASDAETARQATTSLVAEAQGYADASAQSATASANSAEQAESAKGVAQSYAQDAQTSATYASVSESTANAKAQSASADADRTERARDAAEGYASNAQESAQASGESALSASNSALSSGEYASNALGYAESASESAQASAQSATASANSATTAQGYASNAQLSATQASNSARSANQSASDALTFANTASNKATEASTSAQTASAKATESAQSASQALGYKNDAEQAKTASQTAQGLAESARDTAVSAKTGAESARDDAETARDEAQQAVASIADALDDKAPVITDTASGAIASFSDGADNLPLKSLIVDINPVQDLSHGDPSPENICPISGWTEVDVNHSDADMTNPTTLTIQLGQTVYGGKLDVLSGELVIDRAIKTFDGTENWQKYVSREYCYNIVVGDNEFGNDGVIRLIANTYKGRSGYVPTIAQIDLFDTGIYSADGSRIRVYDKRFTALDAFKAYLADNPLQVVYKLATPITVALTPNELSTLLGANNIWSDAGEVTAEYRADTKLFIERLTAPDSEDMIADANITSGQYFMVGNSLFKATANIANGAQIIVGTNAVRKSLSEALNEINA